MKVPKAKQLPSGSWRTEVMVLGRRYSFVSEDKDEAERLALICKLQQSTDEKDRKKLLDSITFREAIDNYISDTNNVLSPATIKGYRSLQSNRFQSIMDLPLSANVNWQQVINDEKKKKCVKVVKTKDPGKPYKTYTRDKCVSAKTITNSWGLIHKILKYYRIPVPEVILPMRKKTEHLFLEPDDIKVFLNAVQGHTYELPYLLCLSGLRRSEMLAVRKEDIIFPKNKKPYIRVSGSKVYDEHGELIEKEENKTEESTRNVPIMIPRILELVGEAEDGYLCKSKPGWLLDPLNKLLRNNNLPEVGLHGLRHTFASLCYHLNIPELVTMKWGGWSDPTVVRKIYTHLANKDEEESMEKMEYFYAE